MAEQINNVDIFKEFYQNVKNSADEKEILKTYGGACVYIPSYKSTVRNEDIIFEYNKLLNSGLFKAAAIRRLATKYDLSVASVYAIVKKQ